ncbi:unnamed protein product, partial [Mesorhabditis spiculigera]
MPLVFVEADAKQLGAAADHPPPTTKHPNTSAAATTSQQLADPGSSATPAGRPRERHQSPVDVKNLKKRRRRDSQKSTVSSRAKRTYRLSCAPKRLDFED